RYRARNCKGCQLRCRCHKSRSERIIQVNHCLRKIKERVREKLLSDEGRSRSERIVQVNHRLRKIKEREREKLLSDEGLKYRSQRPQDVEAVFGNLKNNKHFKWFHLRGFKKVEIVEAVFGNLKNNKHFKRFHLRGLKKVEIEFGLLAIAHNLAKVAS
ncbi:transposase, partial [Parabacteroides sp. CAG:2]|uniref:transposase n=1 Tax=Parabacteroides sp. CAG:2 TaxID=1262912 RepID=UPI0025907F18